MPVLECAGIKGPSRRSISDGLGCQLDADHASYAVHQQLAREYGVGPYQRPWVCPGAATQENTSAAAEEGQRAADEARHTACPAGGAFCARVASRARALTMAAVCAAQRVAACARA
eukprot:CAMPEP_0119385512 /NCGR_PEP_ID=MMETSP1334-20130426/91546_1 /TAXON_ID=127549 /ORGANISM="Calcidiscus leptoporus, Strain RCC1130" /LENGTH=115 /DNA_ID=CAMNT_0007406807 /DNA_START=55 /DNA_END=398 /DNA_ORIENTATION=-